MKVWLSHIWEGWTGGLADLAANVHTLDQFHVGQSTHQLGLSTCLRVEIAAVGQSTHQLGLSACLKSRNFYQSWTSI